MRFRTILTLATFLLLCFTVAIWSDPLPTHAVVSAFNPAAPTQSVSGKVSAIGDTSFSVDVKKSQDVQTLQFLVDENTKIQGKLEVGSQAIVEYREDNDKNIAVNVVVQPSSTLHP